MRTKKQAAERSGFGHYVELVKALAKGEEADADEVAAVLDATGKDEIVLESDVNLQQLRFAWHSQRIANEQATRDRLQAERELATSQQALQAAFDKLQPAVDAARNRLNDASHRILITAGAEGWLSDSANLLDVELLQRESAVNDRLKEVNTELRPLLQDREHKQHSLENAEFNLAKIRSRDSRNGLIAGIENFINQPLDLRQTSERVADLRNQLTQLEQGIRPRLAEQHRLQNELQTIHAEKLKP
ncbi:MAG: hypothetical protein ACK526_01030 [Planctomyces sp.]